MFDLLDNGGGSYTLEIPNIFDYRGYGMFLIEEYSRYGWTGIYLITLSNIKLVSEVRSSAGYTLEYVDNTHYKFKSANQGRFAAALLGL